MVTIGIDTHKATLASLRRRRAGTRARGRHVRERSPGPSAAARLGDPAGSGTPVRHRGLWELRRGARPWPPRGRGDGDRGAGHAHRSRASASAPAWQVGSRRCARHRPRGAPRADPAPRDACRDRRRFEAARRTARDELQAERTRVANRLHADLLVLAPGYGDGSPTSSRPVISRRSGRLLGRSPAVRAQLARRRLARLRALDREIVALEAQLAGLVAASGSSLPCLPGIGVLLAAKLLGETGDVRRFRSGAAFAAVTGTAPIPASSGQTQRHRLNRGGNRQLNRALHFMAIVQARTHPRRPGLCGPPPG